MMTRTKIPVQRAPEKNQSFASRTHDIMLIKDPGWMQRQGEDIGSDFARLFTRDLLS